MKKEFTRPLLSLCILILIACAGCATDKKVIAQADTVDKGLSPAEFDDQQINEYLARIGDRIVTAARQSNEDHYGPKTHYVKGEPNDWMFSDKITYHLVNSKTLNAFTTGGTHIYIYNALFQLCQNEDELAAVMAHEYGHIYCRHVDKGMNRQYGVLAASALAGGAGYVLGGTDSASSAASFGSSGAQFFVMGRTRGDEAQADETGMHFYQLAGYDPRAFGAFFQAMIDKGYDKVPAYQSDHPTLKSRVQIADKRVAELERDGTIDQFRRPPVATPEQFVQYRERAAHLSREVPDDKSLHNSQQLLQALPRSCIAADPNPPDAQEARKKLVESASPQQQ
jgi:predicted Zn-dependent protease